MLPQSSYFVYFERKPKNLHIRIAQLTVSCKLNQILNISLILQYKGFPPKKEINVNFIPYL